MWQCYRLHYHRLCILDVGWEIMILNPCLPVMEYTDILGNCSENAHTQNFIYIYIFVVVVNLSLFFLVCFVFVWLFSSNIKCINSIYTSISNGWETKFSCLGTHALWPCGSPIGLHKSFRSSCSAYRESLLWDFIFVHTL